MKTSKSTAGKASPSVLVNRQIGRLGGGKIADQSRRSMAVHGGQGFSPCVSTKNRATSLKQTNRHVPPAAGQRMPSRPKNQLISLFSGLLMIASAGTFASVLQGQVPTRDDIDDAQSIDLPKDPAAIVAYVGQTPILLGDLMPKVEARIADVVSKTEQEIPEQQLHFARVNLIRGLLVQAIQNKMMREAFLLDQVGSESAEKRMEADEKLTGRARQMFFESEIPELQEQYDVTDLTKLDRELRKKGSSLSARQREFVDQMLGHLYVRSRVERDPSVSIAEITEHYYANLKEYERPTRARWEQLSVLFSKFPSRQEAQEAIWGMGREAYYGGSMQAVARTKSQEPFAKSGGVHDWTAKGSLASEPIDEQVFSIPLDKMSEIIEDTQGFHIVRVLERQEAGVVPLSEVQDEIRGEVRQEKIAKSQRSIMEDMQVMIPVWSLFPDDTPGAKPLPASIARRYSATKQR